MRPIEAENAVTRHGLARVMELRCVTATIRRKLREKPARRSRRTPCGPLNGDNVRVLRQYLCQGTAQEPPIANLTAMHTRLPPTRELLDALKRKTPAVSDTAGSPTAAMKLMRLQRGLLVLFWACSVAALLVTGAVLYTRYQIKQTPAPWLARLVYSLLGGSVAGLAALLLTHLPALARKLRDPLGALADQVDRHDEAESALLRSLARVPAQALRARARRVEVQLRMWEGMARTIGLLIAVSPAALVLVTGLFELPRKGGSLLPLLSLYGLVFVSGAALAVFLQLQVSRPLRRLAYVLGEAAQISAQLEKAPTPPAAASAVAAAVPGVAPIAAPASAVPSPAPVPPEVLQASALGDAAAASPEEDAAAQVDHADHAAAAPPTLPALPQPAR